MEGNVRSFPLDARYARKPGVAAEVAGKRDRWPAAEAEDGDRHGRRRGEDRQDPLFDEELAFHLSPLREAEDPGIVDEEGDAVATLAQGEHGEVAERGELGRENPFDSPRL